MFLYSAIITQNMWKKMKGPQKFPPCFGFSLFMSNIVIVDYVWIKKYRKLFSSFSAVLPLFW